MASPRSWSCDCGEVRLRVGLAGAARVVCHCRDCRAFLVHLDHAHLLDAAGGTSVVQTLPERVEIVSGRDRIGCLYLSGPGRLRWFATCCRTPLGFTFRSRWVPYLSIVDGGFSASDGLGPVQAHAHRRQATARIIQDTGNMKRVMTGMALRAARSYLTAGPWRSPFRTMGGAPIAEPQPLGAAERARAYGGERGS